MFSGMNLLFKKNLIFSSKLWNILIFSINNVSVKDQPWLFSGKEAREGWGGLMGSILSSDFALNIPEISSK